MKSKVLLILVCSIAMACNSNNTGGDPIEEDKDDVVKTYKHSGWGTASKIFLLDTESNNVRVVDKSSSIINTFTGTGVGGYSAEGVLAANAQVHYGVDILAVNDSDVIFTNGQQHCVQAIKDGAVVNVAGTCGTGGFAGSGGIATSALINFPSGLCADSKENLYIVSEEFVSKVDATTGILTTFAGTGVAGSYSAINNGNQATTVDLPTLGYCVFDADDNMYLSTPDEDAVYKIATDGILTTFAGTGPVMVMAVDYGNGGQANAAPLDAPSGVAVDKKNKILFIADKSHSCIRQVSLETGIIDVFAGSCGDIGDLGDGGLATAAELSRPEGIYFDGENLYISTTGSHKIKLVNSSGIISNFAGSGIDGSSGDGGDANAAQIQSVSSWYYFYD